MLHFFWSFTAFIVEMCVLITVHEFGHFWIARRCGVIVKRFSIGFGRPLWRRLGKDGTEYVIGTIPLGGYVKMFDKWVENESDPENFHKAFNHKTILQRTAIIAAGPIFNFIFAIFIYWIVFLIGMPSYRPIIGEVIPHSIAAKGKIFPGMEIKSVDGIETFDWDSVRLQLINKIGKDKITIGIAPTNSQKIEHKILDLSTWQFNSKKQDIVLSLGVIPLGPHIEPILTEVQPGSVAMKAGLKVGDRIVKINGQPIITWQFFVTKIRNNPGQLLEVEINRYGKVIDIILQPDYRSINEEGLLEGFIGVVPKIIPLSQEYKIFRNYTPLSALAQAGKKTWDLMRLMVNTLAKLITGDINLNNLSGPISIAQGAGKSAEYGFIYYLMFLAMISINLGIINLFPLPMLDGGHLLFLAIEKCKGGPISDRVQNFSYRISSILLAILMVLAIFNDFSRLR